MKRLVLLSLFIVTACTTVQPRIDPPCDRVGLFARSVAVVRDIGVKEVDFDNYVVSAQAQTFPVGYIRSMVYTETTSPVDTYAEYYNKCVMVGYSNMFLLLRKEEKVSSVMRQETQRQYEDNRARALEEAYVLPSHPVSVPPVGPESSKPKHSKTKSVKPKSSHVYGSPISVPLVRH